VVRGPQKYEAYGRINESLKLALPMHVNAKSVQFKWEEAILIVYGGKGSVVGREKRKKKQRVCIRGYLRRAVGKGGAKWRRRGK